MFNKKLVTALTVIFAPAYSKALASSCATSVTVAPGATCNGTAVAAGISVEQLSGFNPGLNCSSLAAGQELCVDGEAHPPGHAISLEALVPHWERFNKYPCVDNHKRSYTACVPFSIAEMLRRKRV
ncbi:hypothetical protein DXG01_005580 [Tephrocybe rancida]|nr:hypothetical protein DXG01_005580 [Tephrocybe rancida]